MDTLVWFLYCSLLLKIDKGRCALFPFYEKRADLSAVQHLDVLHKFPANFLSPFIDFYFSFILHLLLFLLFLPVQHSMSTENLYRCSSKKLPVEILDGITRAWKEKRAKTRKRYWTVKIK